MLKNVTYAGTRYFNKSYVVGSYLNRFKPTYIAETTSGGQTASPVYFAERGTPRSPGELTTHDCITFEGLASPDGWKFAVGKSTTLVAIHSRLVVNTAEAAIDAAIAGVGITRVLSYQAASALRAGTLARTLRKFEPAPWPVSLVYAGQGLLPLKLRAFLDFAAPSLKGRLAQIEE